LVTAGVEERIGHDDDSAGPLFDEGREGRLNVGFGADVQIQVLLPQPVRCFHDFGFVDGGIRIVRVRQNRNHGGARHQVAQQLQTFRRQDSGE
jgi:hypothetical protein